MTPWQSQSESHTVEVTMMEGSVCHCAEREDLAHTTGGLPQISESEGLGEAATEVPLCVFTQ